MARSIDDFWKLLEEIQGSSTDLTEAVKSIAKNEKTVSETLFSNIIDQPAYNSQDYQRIRAFLRDWYAALRSLTSFQSNINDIYQLPNDQLDELFQSFGFNLSTSLRYPVSNESPPDKINLFLDLVNLYKIKGSPQALLNVLRYYGLVDVDLYELSLQFDDRLSGDINDLVFKGRVAAGTTNDLSPIYFPFNLLTQRDPHWLQTESQIRNLFANNHINFPSQSPYFAVKPLFDEKATDAATGIIRRKVQDKYDIWEASGFPSENVNPVLPQDTIISITGDQCSLLTLYLSCIYVFNKEFTVGADADRFIIYSGTNEDASAIIEEFTQLTEMKVLSREDHRNRLDQYKNLFSRLQSTNFLQTHNDASVILDSLNPVVKNNLDLLGTDNVAVLGTLLRDLGEWVRANLSYGFINMSYILFGIDSLFDQVRDVIEFFKPYRARLIPIEMLEFRNRLFNSIVVEDTFDTTANIEFHNFLVGDSIPCCSDATCTQLFQPREFFDCGSYFDIGAVTDLPRELQIDIEQSHHDMMKCPHVDTTGYVVSEIVNVTFLDPYTDPIPSGTNSVTIALPQFRPNLNYGIGLSIRFDPTIDPLATPEQFAFLVTDKKVSQFTVSLSGNVPNDSYFIDWYTVDSTYSGSVVVADDSTSLNVVFSHPCSSVDYTVSGTLTNYIDSSTTIYAFSISDKTALGFKVNFSGPIDSPNYKFDYFICSSDVDGVEEITNNNDVVSVAFTQPLSHNVYPLITTVEGDNGNIYAWSVIDKTAFGFTVKLSGPTDSTGVNNLSWAIPDKTVPRFTDFNYFQSGGFRDFDEPNGGTFDCSYSSDLVFITVEEMIAYLLQENGFKLLQENGYGILL